MACVVAIGLFFARRANQSTENYFLGGRSLGPWIAAMSAEASDMSGWLLMGLPGVAYWCGISDAAWTAIGLALAMILGTGVAAAPCTPPRCSPPATRKTSSSCSAPIFCPRCWPAW